jgi:hypothetical protein
MLSCCFCSGHVSPFPVGLQSAAAVLLSSGAGWVSPLAQSQPLSSLCSRQRRQAALRRDLDSTAMGRGRMGEPFVAVTSRRLRSDPRQHSANLDGLPNAASACGGNAALVERRCNAWQRGCTLDRRLARPSTWSALPLITRSRLVADQRAGLSTGPAICISSLLSTLQPIRCYNNLKSLLCSPSSARATEP